MTDTVQDLADKPFILKPDLSSFAITALPIWVSTDSAPEGVQAILLESVPDTYASSLEENGFSEFAHGWIRDARGLTEVFWKQIFGDIAFTKEKPVHHISPKTETPLPPPQQILSIIECFSDEHISWLAKSKGVVGHSQIRLLKKRAIKGRYDQPGAWDVIRFAALERLDKNPEDSEALEYIWNLGKEGKFDTSSLPRNIGPDKLIEKAIERGRVTAGIEKALPMRVKQFGTAGQIATISWSQLTVFIGRLHGGMVESIELPDRLSICIYLKGNEFTELVPESLDVTAYIDRVDSAIELAAGALNHVQQKNDWASEIVLPGAEIPATTDDNSSPQSQELSDNSPTDFELEPLDVFLTWDEVYGELEAINNRIDQLTPLASAFARKLVYSTISQKDYDITNARGLSALKRILRFFNNVVDKEHIEQTLRKNSDDIQHLCDEASPGCDSAFICLRKLTKDPVFSANIAHSALDETDKTWWARGFRIVPTVNQQWTIHSVNSEGNTKRYTDSNYDDYGSALSVLKYKVRSTRLKPLNTGATTGNSNLWKAAYLAEKGAIALLDTEASETIEMVDYRLDLMADSLLNTPKIYPFYLVPSGEEDLDQTAKLKDSVALFRKAVGLTEEQLWLNGSFVVEGGDSGYRAEINGVHLYKGDLAGLFGFIWGKAFYRYLCSSRDMWDLRDLSYKLLFRKKESVLDFDIHEQIIDEISESDALHELLGEDGVYQVINAVESPSKSSYLFLRELLASAMIKNVSSESITTLRTACQVSRQYGAFSSMTPEYRAALAAGFSEEDVLGGALSQWLWQRIRWMGSERGGEWLTSAAFNSQQPSIDFFPQEFSWDVHALVDSLMSAFAKRELPVAA